MKFLATSPNQVRFLVQGMNDFNLDSVFQQLCQAPSSYVQDKISFIINNLSAANIEDKAHEFMEILEEQYYPWFARYMVIKRASLESNFHDLYLKFLDKVNSKALNREIIQATYENCKVLLGSDLIKSNLWVRSLLKNSGSWLGKLTVGRNQVLRASEIDPKSLIIEAYEKGLMIAVIPFTSKILESCQSSPAYQPPNPWTVGILGLLAEIYSIPNLKMNLKIGIEVLYKHLGMDIKEVTQTALLNDCKREIEGNPDFCQGQIILNIKPALGAPSNPVDLPLDVSNSAIGGQTPVLPQDVFGLIWFHPLHLPHTDPLVDEKIAALDQLPSPWRNLRSTSSLPYSIVQLPSPLPNFGTNVTINQKLYTLGLHALFQRVLPIAMDRAIEYIRDTIVHISVSISTQTMKELVSKDYAMESDETRILDAAHLMVAGLAGSLAHVTCKEPLRRSISSELRNFLEDLSIPREFLERAVELGCVVIVQAAANKAIQTIDGEIGQHLALRRNNWDGMGPTFFNKNLYMQGSMGGVPQYIFPKPIHLLPQRVHEVNHGHSSGLDFTASEAVSRQMVGTLDLSLASNYSASSILFRPTDAVSQRVSKNESAVSSFPSSAITPQSSNLDVQPAHSPMYLERLPSNVSEPSVTTRDADSS